MTVPADGGWVGGADDAEEYTSIGVFVSGGGENRVRPRADFGTVGGIYSAPAVKIAASAIASFTRPVSARFCRVRITAAGDADVSGLTLQTRFLPAGQAQGRTEPTSGMKASLDAGAGAAARHYSHEAEIDTTGGRLVMCLRNPLAFSSGGRDHPNTRKLTITGLSYDSTLATKVQKICLWSSAVVEDGSGDEGTISWSRVGRGSVGSVGTGGRLVAAVAGAAGAGSGVSAVAATSVTLPAAAEGKVAAGCIIEVGADGAARGWTRLVEAWDAGSRTATVRPWGGSSPVAGASWRPPPFL